MNEIGGPNFPDFPGGKYFEDQVNKFNRKAAGEGGKWFIKFLGTATEPFFRVGMGERHYNYGDFIPASIIWLNCALLGWMFSPGTFLLGWVALAPGLERYQHLLGWRGFPLLAGLVMAFFQWKVGLANVWAAKARLESGATSHSRSRGTPRYANETLALVKIEVLLAIFNLPIAVLFGIGYGISASLKSAQDAAIRQRYLDAVDAEIERVYLKDCALGKVPPDVTFLYHPIDPSIEPATRENIAASMVGEPVKIIGTPPRKRGDSQTNQRTTPVQPTPEPSPRAQAPAAQQFQQGKSAPAPSEPERQQTSQQNFFQEQEPEPPAKGGLLTEEQLLKAARFGVFLRRAIIFLFFAGALLSAFYFGARFVRSFWKSHPIVAAQSNPQPAPVARAAAPTPQNQIAPAVMPAATPPNPVTPVAATPAPPQQIANPQPPAPEVVQQTSVNPISNESPASSPKIVHVLPGGKTIQVSNPTPASAVRAEFEAFNAFQNFCVQSVTNDLSRLDQIPNEKYRDQISGKFNKLSTQIGQLVNSQKSLLIGLKPGVPADELAVKNLPPMLADRERTSNALHHLDIEISNAIIAQ
jgi:hypothetical protein